VAYHGWLKNLEHYYQVSSLSVCCAERGCGCRKPVGENTILSKCCEGHHGTEMAVIDRGRQASKAPPSTNRTESPSQATGPVLIHGQAGDEVVLINRDPHRVRNNHHEQQPRESVENEAGYWR